MSSKLSKAPKIQLVVGAAVIGVVAFAALAWWYWSSVQGVAPVSTTGLYGKVSLQEGNCMPQVGAYSNGCKTSTVSRRVYFYKPALAPADVVGTHYAGGAKPAATAQSDTAGHYKIDLAAGDYSVLAEDDGGPFCNLSSGTAACGLTVSGGPQQYDITIDHATH